MYNYDNMLDSKLSRERHQHLVKEARLQGRGKSKNKPEQESKGLVVHMKRLAIATAQLLIR